MKVPKQRPEGGWTQPTYGLAEPENQRPRAKCNRGHELTEENSYVVPSRGWRECRICRRARLALYRKRNRRWLKKKAEILAKTGRLPPPGTSRRYRGTMRPYRGSLAPKRDDGASTI